MTSKIAIDRPGSFALLNGDEAVARGAMEAGVKVAASIRARRLLRFWRLC